MFKLRELLKRMCLFRDRKQRCPHMAVALKRWAPLRSWCRVLRGRLSVEYTSEPEQEGFPTRSRFRALVLTLDETEDAISLRQRRKIRDAIELVLLALQSDLQGEAWEQVVRVLCSTPDFFPPNHVPSELVPRLHVRHVAYGTFWYDTVDVYSSMWLDDSYKLRSSAYKRTLKWLQGRFDEATRSTPILIKLQFTPSFIGTSRGSCAYLDRVTSLLTGLRQQFSGPIGVSPLRLEAVAFDFRSLAMNSSCLQSLRRLQLVAPRIDSLVMCPMLKENEGTNPLTAICGDINLPVHALTIENSAELPGMAVWQALRIARAVKEVAIYHPIKGTPDQRTVTAMWHAHALLDPRSPSSVESVRFTEGPISRDDIAAMNLVLTADNAGVLLGLPCIPDAPRIVSARRKLRALELSLAPASDAEFNDFLQLLGRIGVQLEDLTLDFDRFEMKDEQLKGLFLACPRLKRLRLQRFQLSSLDLFVSLYQTKQIRFLESLALEDLAVFDRRSLIRFLQATNDRRSPVHHVLKDFVFDNYLHETLLDDMVSLLEQNATLRHVGLRITSLGMSRYRSALKRQHLAHLPLAQTPFPLESKVAFILAARHKLNGDVCRHIFNYAGEGVRRKLVCFVYDWIRLPDRFEL